MDGSFGFPWYLIAAFWILVTLLFTSGRFRWLVGDIIGLAMHKRSRPYIPPEKKNDTLTSNKINQKNTDYASVYAGLKALDYTSAEAREGADYSTTVYPKASLEVKLKEALNYMFEKKHSVSGSGGN